MGQKLPCEKVASIAKGRKISEFLKTTLTKKKKKVDHERETSKTKKLQKIFKLPWDSCWKSTFYFWLSIKNFFFPTVFISTSSFFLLSFEKNLYCESYLGLIFSIILLSCLLLYKAHERKFLWRPFLVKFVLCYIVLYQLTKCL